MKNLKKNFFIFALIIFNLNADQVKVKNKTKQQIYVATYYSLDNQADRVGQIQKIESSTTIFLTRPDSKWFKKKIGSVYVPIRMYDRDIIFSVNEQDLKNKLNESEYRNSQKINIGGTQGCIFYIWKQDNVFHASNWIEWKMLKPFLGFFQKITDPLIESVQELIEYNQAKEVAFTKVGNALCLQEQDYLKKRLPKVQKNLEKFLGIKIEENKIPRIAFCCSGGGFRAMIATMGSFLGADQIGLFDCTTYVSALSGSTWLLVPWMFSQERNLNEYKEYLKDEIDEELVGFFNTPIFDVDGIIENIVTKILYDQEVTVVDIYGAILANKLLNFLGSEHQTTHYSELQNVLAQADLPLPICTAIEGGPDVEHKWFEFTPYQIGSSQVGAYVQTPFFGRKFVRGSSQDFAPEQCVGFYLGVFGSAFAVNFEELLNEFKVQASRRLSYEYVSRIRSKEISRNTRKNKKVYEKLQQLIHDLGVADTRLLAAEVFNFTYGMRNFLLNKILHLVLADAGIDFNLPFPPLLRPERKIDVIIACDYSANIKDFKAIKGAEEFANKHGLKFPKIDYKDLDKKIISVFEDVNDPQVPTVIYLPLIKNENYSNFDPEKVIEQGGYCGTFNFEYTPAQVEELSGLTQFGLFSNENIIKTAILRAIAKK